MGTMNIRCAIEMATLLSWICPTVGQDVEVVCVERMYFRSQGNVKRCLEEQIRLHAGPCCEEFLMLWLTYWVEVYLHERADVKLGRHERLFLCSCIVLSHACGDYFQRLASCSVALLLAVPHSRDLVMPHLLLQLKYTVKQSFGGRWTARDEDVDWKDTVHAANDTIAVVVVATSISTAAHADDPLGVWHLVVAKTDSRGHFVGDGAGDDHNVRLAWGGSEDDTKTILIVAWHRAVHHLNAAACESEGQGPYGALSRPVGNLVERGEDVIDCVVRLRLRGQRSVGRETVPGGEETLGGRRFGIVTLVTLGAHL
jgi:hypothetical protein